MGYKRRPKNKQEISPNSGSRDKKPPVFKTKIRFTFTSESITYTNGQGRLKVDTEGFISFLIKDQDKWKNVKGELVSLQVKQIKHVAVQRKRTKRTPRK